MRDLFTMFTLMIAMLCMVTLDIAPAEAGFTDEGVLTPFEAAQPALLGSAVNLVNTANNNATVTNAVGIRPAALIGQIGIMSDGVIGYISQPVRGGAIVSWASTEE